MLSRVALRNMGRLGFVSQRSCVASLNNNDLICRHYMPRQVKARKLQWFLENERPVKVPAQERKPGPRFLIKQLNAELKEELITKYPRDYEPFRAGDKIEITRYISMMSEKMERIRGMVVETRAMNSVKASFVVINVKMGMGYEYHFPLYSPFIQKIRVIKRGNFPKKAKLRHIRNMEHRLIEC